MAAATATKATDFDEMTQLWPPSLVRQRTFKVFEAQADATGAAVRWCGVLALPNGTQYPSKDGVSAESSVATATTD